MGVPHFNAYKYAYHDDTLKILDTTPKNFFRHIMRQPKGSNHSLEEKNQKIQTKRQQ